MNANETTRQETKMTQKLTTIVHHTAFNNEQSPYYKVSYKRTRNDNVKQFKREKKYVTLYDFLSELELLRDFNQTTINKSNLE